MRGAFRLEAVRDAARASPFPRARELAWFHAPGARGEAGEYAWHPTLGWVPDKGAEGPLRLRPVPGSAPDGPTLLVVGDSYAWGFGVSPPETLPAHLASRLPGVRVLNAGVPGYGHDQAWLRALQVVDAGERVDHVLLVWVSTDVGRNASRFSFFGKPAFGPGHPPVPLQAEVPSRAAQRARIRRRSHAVDLLRGYLGDRDPPIPEKHRLAGDLLTALADDLAERGIPLTVLDAPASYEIEQEANGWGRPVEHEVLAAWCPRPGHACVDAWAPAVRVFEAGHPVDIGSHWTSAVMEAMAADLVASGRLDALVASPAGALGTPPPPPAP